MSPANNLLRSACTAVLIVALACGVASAAHAQTGNDSAAAHEGATDAGTEPGDDFFLYANGGWLKATEIPAGKGRWGARDEIAQQTRQQVVKLLDDANSAPPGSDARKVADFRAAYLNEAAIEARGNAPLKPLLDRIDRVRDKAGLTRLLGSELRSDVDPMNLGVYNSSHILGLAVQAGNHGEKNYVAYLLQGGLGLPDREHYLGADPRMQALRIDRQAAIGHMLARLGVGAGGPVSGTARRAEAVMALETAIARSHATREASADEHNANSLWTRADFAREAPGMDWTAFFAAGGLARQQTFVAWQPSALKGALAKLNRLYFGIGYPELGADYDADGRLNRWWTDDDMARYRAATEALVRQFSGYRPFSDAAVDGRLGLTENLADLGGLVAAFDAYRRTLGAEANDKEYLRQQDRQFFIGFARSGRAKYRDDALRAQAASDHAPENYRVSTVRNMDAWYEAFDVKPGQRLYLNPGARVRIW